MSSPVLTIAHTRSAPATSTIPLASLAPPVPPARTTTPSPIHAPRRVGQAGQADPRVGLVAGVNRDQQSRQRLGGARHLEASAVHAAQAGDPLDEVGGLTLVLARVAAQQHVLLERMAQ